MDAVRLNHLEMHFIHHDRFDRILSAFYSLAGGVIFGTVFIDLIPHVHYLEMKYKESTGINQSFPVNYFLICMGFFLTYFFEEGAKLVRDYEEEWRKEEEMKNPLEPYQKRSGKSRKSDDRAANVLAAAVTFALAMSIHSFMEGFTLIQSTTDRIVELLLALVLFKLVEGLTTGKTKEYQRERTISIITAILVFAFIIPLGSAAGAFVDTYELSETTQDALVIIFESLAGGIFIYVAMIEIITKQRNDEDRILHLWIIFIGVAMVTILHLVFGTSLLRGGGLSNEENLSKENNYSGRYRSSKLGGSEAQKI